MGGGGEQRKNILGEGKESAKALRQEWKKKNKYMTRLQVRQLFLTLESHLSISALKLHNEFLKYSCLGDSPHPEI